MLPVEKGIDVPRKYDCMRIYPFEEMQVGDSFSVEKSLWGALRSSAFKASRSLGRKFTTRVVDNRIRIWRIA